MFRVGYTVCTPFQNLNCFFLLKLQMCGSKTHLPVCFLSSAVILLCVRDQNFIYIKLTEVMCQEW